MDLYNYRVVARVSGGFEFVNVTTGNVLLVTQNVSVATLIRLVVEDDES